LCARLGPQEVIYSNITDPNRVAEDHGGSIRRFQVGAAGAHCDRGRAFM